MRKMATCGRTFWVWRLREVPRAASPLGLQEAQKLEISRTIPHSEFAMVASNVGLAGATPSRNVKTPASAVADVVCSFLTLTSRVHGVPSAGS